MRGVPNSEDEFKPVNVLTCNASVANEFESDVKRYVDLYTWITGLAPTPAQVELMGKKVTDLEVWKASIEHYLWHGWSPGNVAGMVTIYNRGGAGGCFICGHEGPKKRERWEGSNQP